MMTITATSVTGPKATQLTLAATKAFLDVVRTRQLAAEIPAKDRIQLRVVNSADAPELVDPQKQGVAGSRSSRRVDRDTGGRFHA